MTVTQPIIATGTNIYFGGNNVKTFIRVRLR